MKQGNGTALCEQQFRHWDDMQRLDRTKYISGKNLGELALKKFCPRCFWLKRHVGDTPGGFPGIFSTIDSLTKKSAKRSFDSNGIPPGWLGIRGLTEILFVPKIKVDMSEYGGWILTGAVDDAFVRDDGTVHIVDYKTAKYTHTQDELRPEYDVQLNAYALALPKMGFGKVSRLSLVYCEPNEDLDSDDDFTLSFHTHLEDVAVRPDIVPKLLLHARSILHADIPESVDACTGICSWIEQYHTKIHTFPRGGRNS